MEDKISKRQRVSPIKSALTNKVQVSQSIHQEVGADVTMPI